MVSGRHFLKTLVTYTLQYGRKCIHLVENTREWDREYTNKSFCKQIRLAPMLIFIFVVIIIGVCRIAVAEYTHCICLSMFRWFCYCHCFSSFHAWMNHVFTRIMHKRSIFNKIHHLFHKNAKSRDSFYTQVMWLSIWYTFILFLFFVGFLLFLFFAVLFSLYIREYAGVTCDLIAIDTIIL